MLKAELNKYIGQEVTVVFKKDVLGIEKIRGRLGFAYDFSEKYGYRKPNYYYIGEYCFKVSHVKKLFLHYSDSCIRLG